MAGEVSVFIKIRGCEHLKRNHKGKGLRRRYCALQMAGSSQKGEIWKFIG